MLSSKGPPALFQLAAFAVATMERAIIIARTSARNFFRFLIGLFPPFNILPEFRHFLHRLNEMGYVILFVGKKFGKIERKPESIAFFAAI